METVKLVVPGTSSEKLLIAPPYLFQEQPPSPAPCLFQEQLLFAPPYLLQEQLPFALFTCSRNNPPPSCQSDPYPDP